MATRPLSRPSSRVAAEPGSAVSILGAGGHGRVIASLLHAAGIAIAGFWDDDPAKWGTVIDALKVNGPIGEIRSVGGRAIIAIGDNHVRQRIAEELDLEWVSAVHPAAWVDEDVSIDAGTVVCAGAVVERGARIGKHVIINSKAGVSHDAHMEEYAHISAAHLGAGSTAHQGVLIGIGSVVLPFKDVGAWATVGAGAIVTRDVPPGVTVVGNPAHLHPRP